MYEILHQDLNVAVSTTWAVVFTYHACITRIFEGLTVRDDNLIIGWLDYQELWIEIPEFKP